MLLNPEALAQLSGHAAAHLQRRLATAQPHEVLAFSIALDALEEADAHEGVTVNTHERLVELLFEGPERILDEIFPVDVTDSGVLLLGEEVLNIFKWDQTQSFPAAGGDVRAAFVTAAGSGGRHARARLRAFPCGWA
jgi:hypothetical protein